MAASVWPPALDRVPHCRAIVMRPAIFTGDALLTLEGPKGHLECLSPIPGSRSSPRFQARQCALRDS